MSLGLVAFVLRYHRLRKLQHALSLAGDPQPFCRASAEHDQTSAISGCSERQSRGAAGRT